MDKTFEQGRSEIERLCAYYQTNQRAFTTPGVKEAHVRQTLIDPLFEALGWDVRNQSRVAPQYREVITEDSLEIEGSQRAPDYTFRIGTTPRYYAEAKKCHLKIKNDFSPAFQLRTYGWTSKLPLSILTNFEEFSVYDCTKRPKQSDKPGTARILYLTFNQFVDNWRQIWDIYSREAVWSGAYGDFANSKRKRGTLEVDEEFLREIEGWREELAKNIALRNASISADDLNSAVQLTIDRIIFLRMAEDRKIEPDGQLLRLTERENIYERFIKNLCRKADDKYNSGLFHFRREEEVSEDPDRITPSLNIDDRIFRPIIRSLYYEFGSSYQFNVLPVEILGTVYERFLEKEIRLTAGHRVKIEKKPLRRKRHGVYYTPIYVVEYIVNNTVGMQIAGKSPAQLTGTRKDTQFRVLDMACGSGSFLLGAYQCLLQHYLDWYVEHSPDKHPKAILRHPRTQEWRLTIEEKKRILTTHIFGVDIDPQAVEVAKLSLMLKALEGEDDLSLIQQMELFHHRALPNLANNIKCGNSLISPDFFLRSFLHDPEDIKRINPFDWKKAFPEAIKAGGFDCVIGNPPYIQLSMQQFRDERINTYLREIFSISAGRMNTFVYFLLQAHKLCRNNSRYAFIIPNTVLGQEYYHEIRTKILSNSHLEHVASPHGLLFKDAVVETVVLVMQRIVGENCALSNAPVVFSDLHEQKGEQNAFSVPQVRLSENYMSAFVAPRNEMTESIKKKIDQSGTTIGTQFNLNQAIALKHDRAACLTDKKESKAHRMVLDGRHIRRYFTGDSPNYFKFDKDKIHSCKREDIFLVPEKVFFRRVGESIIASLDDQQKFALNTLVVVTPKPTATHNLRVVLALLNSKMMNWYYRTFLKSTKKVFSEIQARQIKQLQLPNPELLQNGERLAEISDCAETLIRLNKEIAPGISGPRRVAIEHQIESFESRIDGLIYACYGLNEEEISLIEG